MPAAVTVGAPVLVLDAALEGCLAAVVQAGAAGFEVVAERRAEGLRASTSVLPDLVAQVLRAAGIEAPALSGIGVTVGPGSFTGVRAALALAQGVGLAAGVAVAGVTVGAAIRAGLGAAAAGRPVWVVIDSKRGRVFLDRAGVVEGAALDALPPAGGPVALAGNAAEAVMGAMATRGDDLLLLRAWRCEAAGIAAAMAAGGPAVPLYVDGVAARVQTVPG